MQNETSQYRSVEFQSEGAIPRGRLYLPGNKSGKLPVIIMAHGYSATLENMVAININFTGTHQNKFDGIDPLKIKINVTEMLFFKSEDFQ